MNARKIKLSVIVLSLVGFSSSYAEAIPLRSDVQSSSPHTDVLWCDDNELRFETRIPYVDRLEGTLNGRKWDRFEIPGGGYELDMGAPEVPHLTHLVAIPTRSGVRATVEALEVTTLTGIQLMPAQGIAPEDLETRSQSIQYDASVYSDDSFYPSEEVMIGEPALMRGQRLVALRINPVRYNPVTGELQIVHHYRVTVHFEGIDLRNVPSRPMHSVSRSWVNLMRSSIVNFEQLGMDVVPVGSYLIICIDDPYLVNILLQPLVEWKIRKGHEVHIETFPPGATRTEIKGIIQNAYDNWEIPPEFVLLFGDTEGDYELPGFPHYFLGYLTGYLDHPYSQLEGNDVLADVALGRIPAENDYEVIVGVNKILYYEKMPYIANDDWYHRGCLVAGNQLAGISSIETNRWIKTRMVWNEYTRIDTFWWTMPSGSVAQTITNAIDDGVLYCNYRGDWGMENFTNLHIENLNNGRKLPFVTILTCGTGGFSVAGGSFQETFINVGSPSTPQGAAACVGMVGVWTETRCNNTLDVGMYAGIFDEGITQAGNATNRGKLEIYNAYQINEPDLVENYNNWLCLAGDPGLELFTSAIQYIECAIPPTVILGENVLNLTVTETGIGPLEEATVCLWKAGELHKVDLTDASGQITLPLNDITTGNVKVTITKQNFYPILDSLDVIQDGVAVGYYGHNIDDDNSGTSSGDNDGIVNPCETVEIPLIFKNYGSSSTATNISVTATESDDYITLSDDTETFPDLTPGTTGSSDDDLDLIIAQDCPHGHAVLLDFVTSTSQGTWNGVLELEVISSDILIELGYAAGSDSLLSPGETSDFILTITNDGGKEAAFLMATINALSPYVTVNDSSASFGTVAIDSTASCTANPFNLTTADHTPPGQQADLEVTFITVTGATQKDTITIALGSKTTTDPQGPDEYGYYCFDDIDLDYMQAPTYDWVEIDPNYGGMGEELPIVDPGENLDSSIVVSLPFTFQYYGENTDEITVCSNGWISAYPNAALSNCTNYPIPSSMGPNGLIAAFWDELITWSGGHVYAWSDTANHRFIIEWSRMKNRYEHQPQETFEIILFDPVHYPTPTGDGEILFQYFDVTEVYGEYYDNPFSTVGIERPDKQDGIQVVYWNTYTDPAVAQLEDGRAYLFTTNFEYGSSTLVEPLKDDRAYPLYFALYAAYPNPFNPTTTIRYGLPHTAMVELSVYDVSGRRVTDLVDGWREAGRHEVTWDASGLASGVYVYRLEAGEFRTAGKMVLMK